MHFVSFFKTSRPGCLPLGPSKPVVLTNAPDPLKDIFKFSEACRATLINLKPSPDPFSFKKTRQLLLELFQDPELKKIIKKGIHLEAYAACDIANLLKNLIEASTTCKELAHLRQIYSEQHARKGSLLRIVMDSNLTMHKNIMDAFDTKHTSLDAYEEAEAQREAARRRRESEQHQLEIAEIALQGVPPSSDPPAQAAHLTLLVARAAAASLDSKSPAHSISCFMAIRRSLSQSWNSFTQFFQHMNCFCFFSVRRKRASACISSVPPTVSLKQA